MLHEPTAGPAELQEDASLLNLNQLQFSFIYMAPKAQQQSPEGSLFCKVKILQQYNIVLILIYVLNMFYLS